jgi:class 3 adenylate cyclase
MSEERRLVTVLFADVTGSTALGESIDPEDLRLLLGRYYATAKEVVIEHGGTVEKFIGDAVMAVFGLRQAHGDDAARALGAALELRDRVRADARLGERLPIRLGVNTGDVVASRDEGGDDFLVTGDAVNVAARLQQAAAPWTVLAGPRTVRAAHGAFRFSAELQIDAKGKTGGIRASEVIERAPVSRARTPLFGRRADLAQLELAATRAFDERRPFLVTVIAPPGTGKSRLLEEFLSRLQALEPNAQVAVAQCLPYGQRLTYWPLRAVLFRIVGIDDDADAATVRAAIDSWLRAAGVEDADTTGALLASTVGAGESEAIDRSALFNAWRSFIEAAARSAPLVLAVEDLHWSSDTLLDLIEFVLQPRGDTRALMVALARPELVDRRPAWGGGGRDNVSIALAPLDDRSTADLVRHLAEGAPATFVEAVVARAEGNPFFAGEIVNALLEQAESFDDPASLEAALLRLPDTVQATVLARLDLLPDRERELIRIGAVFGRSFRPSGVAALATDVDSAAVVDVCERLAARDLIRPSGADGYAFRHILIREVAYGTLPRRDRAQLHGAAGAWLAERATNQEEAFAELVAYHYREAASLATALELEGAADLRARAKSWLVRAAEVARASAATLEARQHVRAAIDFAEPEDLPALYELLGDVEIGGSTIISTYERALELARQAGQPTDDQLRLLAKRLMVEMRSQGSVARRPSLDEIQAMRSAARALFEQATDVRSRALFLAADAFFPFWANAAGHEVDTEVIRQAEASAERGLNLARQLDDANLQSAALDALGSIAQDRSDFPLAIKLGTQRIAMGSRLALFEQIDAHAVTTWSAAVAGDLATAERVSASGLAIVQPRQAPDWTLHLAAWRLLVLTLVGNWDEVESTAERAYALWTESGRPAAGYANRGFISALIVAHARRDDARIARWSDVFNEIVAEFDAAAEGRRRSDAVVRWDTERLGSALVAAGSRAISADRLTHYLAISNDSGNRLAEAYLLEVLERARRTHHLILEAETLRALGLARGDPAMVRSARDMFEASGALPYVARTRCEAAILSSDRAELEAGLAYLESIRDEAQIERYLHAAASST